MALRPLLRHLSAEPTGAQLLEMRPGDRAFVSSSLRPYVLAALADEDPRRPVLIVAGDDRQARDLAVDIRAWLAPRPVRFYPSRGVAYESHLTPPPHLVGLRVAALDALLAVDPAAEAPVVVVSAVALAEKVPDPALRPSSFEVAKGDLLDLDEVAEGLVRAGYERVDQVDDRGQFAIRGEFRRRRDLDPLGLAERALGEGREPAQRLDPDVEQLDAAGAVLGRREDVEDLAADRELAAVVDLVDPLVARGDEVGGALVEVEQLADLENEAVRTELGVGDLLGQCDRGDDDDGRFIV